MTTKPQYILLDPDEPWQEGDEHLSFQNWNWRITPALVSLPPGTPRRRLVPLRWFTVKDKKPTPPCVIIWERDGNWHVSHPLMSAQSVYTFLPAKLLDRAYWQPWEPPEPEPDPCRLAYDQECEKEKARPRIRWPDWQAGWAACEASREKKSILPERPP